jgi:hypothetical protein
MLAGQIYHIVIHIALLEVKSTPVKCNRVQKQLDEPKLLLLPPHTT